jgi:hypothetical protein
MIFSNIYTIYMIFYFNIIYMILFHLIINIKIFFN